MKIAKIDLKSPKAAEQFVASLKDTGFAIITNHGIDESILEHSYSEWARFFASSNKFNFSFDPKTQEGYFPFKSENAKNAPAKDLKEFYHIYDVNKLPVGGSSTIWLRMRLAELASELLGYVQKVSPPEVRERFLEPLPNMIKDSNSTLFRVLHYPPIENAEEGAVRAAAHEDINLLTLLPSATEAGLEVMGRDGKWISVECDPNSIIVNVGDMLELASGGYFKSTTHQVVNPSGSAAKKSRYSMPLFLHPRPEVRLSENKTAGEYLEERLKELGLK